MAVDITKTRKGLYSATWNAVDLGGFDGVSFDKIKAMFTPIKIGTYGNLKLGERFDGLTDDSVVTLLLKEPSRARIEALSAWSATGNLLEGLPAIGERMELLGQALLLHPTDVGAATTEDIRFYKTVPRPELVQLRPRDNKGEDLWALEFLVYPDLTKLAAGTENPYFNFGTAA